MSALWPDHLLTLAEWDDVPVESSRRLELVEGVVQVVPRPTVQHQVAMANLAAELNRQLPTHLLAAPDVEVLVDAAFPPTVRAPDVVVLPTTLLDSNPSRVLASDVALAVEIVSPGTGRTDRVMKPVEYADARIGAYWVLDLADPEASRAFVLVDGEYEEAARGPHRLTVLSPVPLDIDLSSLTRRR